MTSQAGATRHEWFRGSTSGQSGFAPVQPSARASSAARGRPRLRAGWPHFAGRRGPVPQGLRRSLGKGGAATSTLIGQRPGAMLVLQVQPLHHGLRVPPRARRHLRRATRLGDLVKRQETLARALMGSTCRELAQAVRGLAPTGMINAQHGRGEQSSNASPSRNGETATPDRGSLIGRGLAPRPRPGRRLGQHPAYPDEGVQAAVMRSDPRQRVLRHRVRPSGGAGSRWARRPRRPTGRTGAPR